MEQKPFHRRLLAICGLFAVCMAVFVASMFSAQIVHGEEYLAQSVRTNTRTETVEASRGMITDRNGKVLVSNRPIYTLDFDASLLDSEELNDAIVRLFALLDENGVAYSDDLPLSRTTPFSYDGTPSDFSALADYLVSKKWIDAGAVDQNGVPTDFSALALFLALRTEFDVPDTLDAVQARALIGLRYSLAVAKLSGYSSCTVVSDIDVSLISLLKDGDFAGVTIGTSSQRVYETDAAAHILGRVDKIYKEDWAEYKEKGYAYNDLIGRDGVEAAFEDYLRGTDGKRLVTLNDSGKVIDELYSVEPQPGGTVALTIDIDFQEQVESILAETTSAMTKADGIGRGAAAAVVQVGTGDVLALASYPTFSLSSFREDYTDLSLDPLTPMWNRATQGTYAPGSTIKPLTAVASLESGVTTTTERIFDSGKWVYPGYSASYTYCWNRAGHGSLNVSGAITNSCNYFFAEMGYRLGMDRLNSYFSAFGLGEHTGIEIGDAAGTLPSQEAGTNLAPWAAYGQANQLYTPLQLANYIATLAGGGERYEAHLLKDVRRYDSADLIAVYNEPPVETLSIDGKNLTAVLSGMRALVTSGSISGYFKRCIVDAAAKTGTAQTGDVKNDNGVFVCYAPYDDPQIAVAIVIEKGGTGAALASSAVDILNAYFSSADEGSPILGENALVK